MDSQRAGHDPDLEELSQLTLAYFLLVAVCVSIIIDTLQKTSVLRSKETAWTSIMKRIKKLLNLEGKN
jgi:hypothetical protein